MTIADNITPGQKTGHAAHHNALAAKANELDALVTSGRLSESEITNAIDSAVADALAAAPAIYVINNGDGTLTLTDAAPDNNPPSVPTSVTATATGMTTATLSWSASTDDVGVTGYEYRANLGSVVDAGLVTSINLTSLTPTTTYTLQVRAYDAAGNRSGWATANSIDTFADTTAPTAGTLAASAIGPHGLTLTVSGASDASGLHAQPYRFSTNGGTSYSAWQSGPVFTATGLSPSTTYTCRHQTRDTAGNIATGTAITPTTASQTADSFNRADNSSSLGSTETGEPWIPVGTWGIASNRAKCMTATSNLSATVDAGSVDVRVSAKVYLGSGTDWYNCGFYARFTDENNTVYLGIGDGVLELKRKIGGVDTAIDTATTTIANGDVIGVEVDGTNYAIYKNGTALKSGTDSGLSSLTSTKHGLRIGYLLGSNVVTWDDFAILYV